MGVIQVVPKAGAYVDQWVGLQFLAEEGILPVKKLLKDTPWLILEAVLGAESFVVLVRGNETWRCNHGDFIVKAPYGRVWFMSKIEFESQFFWEAES